MERLRDDPARHFNLSMPGAANETGAPRVRDPPLPPNERPVRFGTCSPRISRTSPNYKLGFKHPPLGSLSPLNAAEEQFGGSTAQHCSPLIDACQRDRSKGSDARVIVPYERYVLGNSQALFVCCLHDAHCDTIRPRKDRSRHLAFSKQLTGCAQALRLSVVIYIHDAYVSLQAGRGA